MTDQERAALELIAHDAGQGAEDRNAALRALGELPPLPAVDPAPVDPAPVDPAP